MKSIHLQTTERNNMIDYLQVQRYIHVLDCNHEGQVKITSRSQATCLCFCDPQPDTAFMLQDRQHMHG